MQDGTGVEKVIWKCVNYKIDGCKGRAHTSEGRVVSHSGNHTCVPEPTKIKVKEVLSELKELATRCSDNPTSLISKCTEDLTPEVTGALPSIRALTKEVQYERKKHEYPTANPTSLADLIIPAVYQETKRQETFLLHDSGPGEDRILVYSTRRNLEFLKNSRCVFGDGTFKVAPGLFEQIYSIHATLEERQVCPLVFTLMNRKSTDAYVNMLTAIKNLIPAWAPEVITTDFESAAIRAFQQVFPQSRLHGCHFHFGQCVWKRIQHEPAVATRYKDSPDFELQVKCLNALAFVPPADVIDSFQELCASQFFR